MLKIRYHTMKRDYFAGRYTIKLVSSILIALCNIIIQFLLPRAISVQEYGFYSYNLNVFTSVIVMANLSMSSALVTKYAKHCEDIGLVRFYLVFYAMMTLILSFSLFGIYKFEFVRESFGGQTIIVCLLGLEASVLIKLMADVVSLYDAAAISRFPSIIQIMQRICLCMLVVGAYFLGHVNLVVFYAEQIIVFSIATAILLFAFFSDHKVNYDAPVIRENKAYLKEYYEFCRPLVVSGVISQGIVVLMNYALMRYAGSAEQAMFGAAWQLNTLVGYVFSPYAELMKREFAVMTGRSEALKYRFWQSVKTIIWLSSYFAVFIAVFARVLLPIIYGDSYNNAVFVTQAIMLYTIFQAWGQLCGSYLIAAELTKGYAVLSVVGQLVSVICITLFQVPNYMFTAGLGSIGIGLTYMCANYISVMIMMIYILKKIGGSHFRMHLIYVSTIALCAIDAWLLRETVYQLFDNKGTVVGILGMIVCGFIYTFVIGITIYSFPRLMGIQRESINNAIGGLLSRWRKK